MKKDYLLKYTPTELPEWFILINDKSPCSTKDVLKLFGYGKSVLVEALAKEYFPKPDFVVAPTKGMSKNFKQMPISLFPGRSNNWYKQTLIKEIIRRQKLLKEYQNDS